MKKIKKTQREPFEPLKKFCILVLKKRSKEIKAIWLLATENLEKEKDFSVVILTDYRKISPARKKSLKKDVAKAEKIIEKRYKIDLHSGFYDLEKYFEKIMTNDTEMFNEILHSIPLYDPTNFFTPLKILAKRGRILGTKEATFRLIDSVKEHFKNIHDFKLEVLDEIYSSVIDAGQAALLAANYSIPVQKHLAKHIKRCFVNKGVLEKEYAKWTEEIVSTFKGFEHGMIKEISGQQIDDLVIKGTKFIKRMDDLVREYEKKR